MFWSYFCFFFIFCTKSEAFYREFSTNLSKMAMAIIFFSLAYITKWMRNHWICWEKSKFENGRSILCLTGWPGNPSALGPSAPASPVYPNLCPSRDPPVRVSGTRHWTYYVPIHTHTPTLHIHHIWSNGSALFPILSDKLQEGFIQTLSPHSSQTQVVVVVYYFNKKKTPNFCLISNLFTL